MTISRIIFLCATMLCCTTAFSQDWRVISTSSDRRIQLMANADTLTTSVDHGKRHLGALMQYKGGEYIPPFVAIIDIDQCLIKHRGQLTQDFGYGIPAEQTTWKYNGPSGKDAQGTWLCMVATDHFKQKLTT